jgi:serine/threonine protein kinase
MNRPKPGDRINNYLLDEKIAAGSFSEVWKAHHHVFLDLVAIKIPTDPQYVRYLQRDGATIHGLRHPNIVRAMDLDPYGDPPYLIMEFVDGPSLRQLIDSHPGGLPLEAVLPMLMGILSALEAAHESGIVHSDIKPGNILIGGLVDLANINSDQVKVADFGLGRRANNLAGTLLQSGSISVEDGQRISGTLAYMSPEQREGQPVDERTDLYAAGVVLHELLTGALPQGGDAPSVIRRDLPRWVDEFFQRCYTHRDRRFESASQMKSIVERHCRTAGSAPPPLGGRVQGVIQLGRELVCVACRDSVEPGDQFCIHCGRQLVQEIPRCPSCHGFVGRDDNFCILCGTDLRQMV